MAVWARRSEAAQISSPADRHACQVEGRGPRCGADGVEWFLNLKPPAALLMNNASFPAGSGFSKIELEPGAPLRVYPGSPHREKTHMRKVLLSLTALAVVGFALPAASTSASAETVIIKKHRDHGWHNGWHHRDRVVVREHRHREGVILREGRRHHDHGVGVVVR
jgi:hypothetical protein